MKRLIPALFVPLACVCLMAESTGRISGKITNAAKQPVAKAKITLKRLDRAWTKDLFTDASGSYMQVGLEPKEFELTVNAEGYTPYVEQIKIPLGDLLVKNITLLTAEEARKQALASGTAQAAPVDPTAALDAEGREAFNQAIPFYNEGKMGEALPLVRKAYKALTEVQATTKDEKTKADLTPELQKIERVLGLCLAQAGEKKEEGEPYLLKALERNPKDERVILALIATSKAKGDKAAEQKFSDALETLRGPDPATIYNKGVEAFNSGNTKEARVQLNKALEVDPKYAEAHYLLAMIDFAENNLRGTKQHLQKYMELAPTGKHAGEAKEMLKDPSLKNIK